MSELRPKASVGRTSVNVSEVPQPHVSAGAGSVWPGDPRQLKHASADSLDRLDQVEPADFGRANKSLAVAASASGCHIGIAYAILVRTRGDHIDERKRFNQIAVEIADGDRGKRSRCSPFGNHEFCSFLTVAGAQRQVKTLNRSHGCTVRFCRVERG